MNARAIPALLAALHLPATAICFYVLDGARWKGDLCAMPSGTLGTAVADSIRDQIKPHVH